MTTLASNNTKQTSRVFRPGKNIQEAKMSLNPISSSYRSLEQAQHLTDPRQLANADEGDRWSTTAKVCALISGFVAFIGGFVMFGPVAAIVATLISGIGTLWLCNSCSDSYYNRRNDPSAQLALQAPWYQRYFPVFNYAPAQPYVYVPAQPHVAVGDRAHNQPPSIPWYKRVFSFIPSGGLHMNNGIPEQHVPVGRGSQLPQIPIGRGNLPPPHVPVGRGSHFSPAATPYGHGHGITNPPPPSGSNGHVQVGRGFPRRP